MRFFDVADRIAPYLGEFLGTFMVVFAVGCNKISGNDIWIPTAGAFTIMVLMYVTFAVSGGLLNPALTVAFGLAGKLSWLRVSGYCTMQVIAGILAAFLASGMLRDPVELGPRGGFGAADVAVVNLVYSTMYCFVGLSCMAAMRVNPAGNENQFFALAVGFVAVAGGHACLEVSGSHVMNPAISLGFGLTSRNGPSAVWAIVYAAYQMAGAAVAATLFFLVRPEELTALGITGKGLSWQRIRQGLHIGRSASTPNACPQFRRQSASQGDAVQTYPADYRPAFPSRFLGELVGTYAIMFTFVLGSALTEYKPTTVSAFLEFDQIAEACPRPAGWCEHGAPRVDDCDGDGVPDLVCSGTRGRLGIISSKAGCTHVWSSGPCVSEAAASELYEVAATTTPPKKVAAATKRPGNVRATTNPSTKVEKTVMKKVSTVAWETGAAVLCMVYSLGNVSGGHFNPAVTLGAMFCRRCAIVEGVFLIIAQVAGCVLGALTFVCVDVGASKTGSSVAPQLGPKNEYHWGSVVIGEGVFTMAVVLVYLCMTALKSPRYFSASSTSSFQYAFAIGMSVAAGGIALSGISGGALNPALSLGVSLSNLFHRRGHFRFLSCLWYILSQLCGGILGGLFFVVLHPAEYKQDPLLDDGDTSCEDLAVPRLPR